MPVEVALDELDMTRYVRRGDLVMWGQSCAEPTPLVERLLAARHDIGAFRCFVGYPATTTARPEHGDAVTFVSYTGSGANRELARTGCLDILPVHYSQLPRLFAGGAVRVDVLVLQVPPAGPDGRYGMGVADEYLSSAVDGARVVVAEVNDRVPRVACGRRLEPGDVDVVVRTSRPLAQVAAREPSPVEAAVARNVAELIPDGATVQVGLGSLPAAVLRALGGHRDLGIHSGMMSDAVADLVEAGVITGARKTVDAGVAVAGVLMGSERLFRFADGNPAVCLRETAYTHDLAVLASQHRFVAVNGAIEVDLTGQVNTEVARGGYVGAMGGAVDFLRGAHESPGGLPVVALPSRSGGHSRVVAELSGPVCVARADVGLVVTEHGVADLRGLTLAGRRERMLAVADPAHRDELEAAVVAGAAGAAGAAARGGQ